MSIVYIILGVIVAVIILVLIIALFVKPDYSVRRDIIINKPKQIVFEYVKYLKNQDNYSKWVMTDPAMKKDYEGIDGTVGFKSSWESKNKSVGKGEQQIVSITEHAEVGYKIHFIKPFEGLANAAITTAAVADKETRVTWSLVSKMTYPMNFTLLFMNMDKILGADLELGLNNLKTVLEKKP